MLNLFGTLLALMIGESAAGQGMFVGPESPIAALAAPLLLTGLHALLAWQVASRWQFVRLQAAAAELHADPALRAEVARERELLLRHAAQLRLGAEVMGLVLFAVVCAVFGWTDYVRNTLGVPEYLSLLPVIAPWLLMQAGGWLCQYLVERRVRGGSWKLLAYVQFQVGAVLALLVPVALVSAAFWAIRQYSTVAADLMDSFQILSMVAQLLVALPLMLFAPLLVRLAVRAQPLPDGPLRRRMVTLARDVGAGVNQILVWRTGGTTFVNAFAIGILPPFKYVFVTDALLKTMHEDEVVAVFAHELGHVKHRHLLWLLGLVLSFLLLLLAGMYLMQQIPEEGPYQVLLTAVLVGYGIFMGGYISRRFERQADNFAARHTHPELIGSVLLRLGATSRRALKRASWRYFSLEQRVRDIIQATAYPEVRRRHMSELRRALSVAGLVTLLAAAVLAMPIRDDAVTGMALFSVNRFDRARVDAGAAKTAGLRDSALARADAMAALGEDHVQSADWLRAIVEGLDSGDCSRLEAMILHARQRAEGSADADERRAWDTELQQLLATEEGIHRARASSTRFAVEYDAALKRRGLKPAER